MNVINTPLQASNEFKRLMDQINSNILPALVTGCIDTQKCQLINTVGAQVPYRIIITHSDSKAKEIYNDYRYFDRQVYIYPAKDVLFYSADVHGNTIVRQRLEILKKIKNREPATIILTIDATMDCLTELKELDNSVRNIKVGQTLDIGKFTEYLAEIGYEKNGLVDDMGQFAVRGGIIDLFPVTEEAPYRIELWGDEIDSIRSFDVDSQRSIENLQELTIFPATEIILDNQRIQDGIRRLQEEYRQHGEKLKAANELEQYRRLTKSVESFVEEVTEFHAVLGVESYIKYFYDKTISFLDLFQKDEALIFLDEPNRVSEKANAFELEFRESMTARLRDGYILPRQADVINAYSLISEKISKHRTVLISTLMQHMKDYSPRETFHIEVKSVSPYNNIFDELVSDLKSYKKRGYKIVVLSPSETRAKRLAEDIRFNEVEVTYQEKLDGDLQPGQVIVTNGKLKRGFEYPLLKFVVISESDIFSAKDRQKKKKKKEQSKYSGAKINGFADLVVGDYVVHERHGLGIYKGLEKIEVEQVSKDYISIEYQGGSNLFIPAAQLDMIQKFSSAGTRKPKLNKLGGPEWEKTKAKVRGEVKDIAKSLVDLYAVRQTKKGFQFNEDTVWQREFEELFPYDETQDQLDAIEATKKDMESTKIMDRLICGDVGYGKTEVAIRAAFKAVNSGKQVVVLVPTTILAQQHYNSFAERMKDFPINIAMLSRFRTPKEQKQTIAGLKDGMVDIVIGTHRVLSKDIVFKDLGLLVVDEEQRFGVTHKEKIKSLKRDVDVLSLSATPIPRTLHMSLIGIRDMSVLEEPPVDRRAIQTYVLEYNEALVREAIHREMNRGGQVYYVYNRVNNIEEITNTIAELVPEANVSFAHGQMGERDLEKIMLQFINGELDVLVSTTIIETGLDIPNVNTMIIHDANQLGLSQLYQLRGRVGRSSRTAYAFLMYKRDTMLKEIAEKRLSAIREFTDLGSGFKIAMRDLEIRGAGNLLGAAQSGHMEAVGYDLYCKMLNDAVRRQRGESIDEEFETAVDLNINAFIPATYVRNEIQKLDLYKRIASIENDEECEDMLDELTDRYGDPPTDVINLVRIALLKAKAHAVFINQVIQKVNKVHFVMNRNAKINVERIDELLKSYDNKLTLVSGENPAFVLDIKTIDKKRLLECVETVINALGQLI